MVKGMKPRKESTTERVTWDDLLKLSQAALQRQLPLFGEFHTG